MDTDNKYGTLEMQQYYLPILNYIDDVCRKNGIKYTLSDGTLIGAVRHKGFIPWDDDIDIALDRDNYNKLLKVLRKDLDPEYKIIRDMWVRRITRKDNPHLKDIPVGGCVDLFVFDNVPDSPIKNKIKNLLIKALQGMLKREVIYEGFSTGYKIILFSTNLFGKFFSRKTKQRWYDKVAQWGNKEHCSHKARYYCSYRYISGIRYPADITEDYTTVSFEGRDYMALKNWDEFLKIDFGDYMQIPPEEERLPKHLR